MTKGDSKNIKGIAILMMLFLHLFQYEYIDFYHPLFYINSDPIEAIITRACRPVPFFFIISGYGLSYINYQNTITIKSQIKRIKLIFTAYWLTLLVFVPIGYLMKYDNYPGDLTNIIGNITSYGDSYNRTMWFLFPYTMICLTSPFIFKCIDRINSLKITFIISLLIYLTSGYIISRYLNEIGGWNSLLTHVLQYLQFSFPFIVGIILHHTYNHYHSLFERVHQKLLYLLLLFLCVIKLTIESQAIDTFYAVFFIIIFINIHIHEKIKKILSTLGEYSMIMWMVHFYLCNIFFSKFFYGFKYSIIIYMMLIICSFVSSYILTKINKRICH